MSKPAGICLPAGFPGAPEAPSTPLTVDPSTTIIIAVLLLRDLLTLSRLPFGKGVRPALRCRRRGALTDPCKGAGGTSSGRRSCPHPSSYTEARWRAALRSLWL